MNLLTPFDFVQKFETKQSIVYCGNAPSLKDEELGDWVDSHDIVIRINTLPCKEYMADTGNITNILVCNPYTCESSEQLPYIPDMLVICLFSLTRRGDNEKLKHWLNGNKVLISYIPDVVALNDSNHFEALTTGTYAINLLNRLLKPKSVSILGFTMFLGDTNHHYWSSIVPKGVRSHDFKIEAKIFISLINRLPGTTKITLTSDIFWVSKKVKVKLSDKILNKKMKNPRWTNESRRFWNF
ncbi:glycosyltransferase family 29 protein [Photobacterium indicum]|uniref:glycosyltransferase family 29 protein n=1 Tax=Photobacterium indicum TaxID=81447 RepID=UPI003D1197D5